MASRDGYFPPESVIRRVGNSPLVPLLGGGPAVLLQVAHPLVAVGVARHSDYSRDLWRRLLRTLRALYLIVYGSKEEAERAGAVVQAVHAHVQGRTTERLGRFPAGTPYTAADPDLMLWVHATLVETSVAAFCRFVAPLDSHEEESYYREMALVGRLFGTPTADIPARLADFREYLHAQLSGPDLCVTDPAREVAAVILEARVPRHFACSDRHTASRPPASCRQGSVRSTGSAGARPTPQPSRSPPARCAWLPRPSYGRLHASRRPPPANAA